MDSYDTSLTKRHVYLSSLFGGACAGLFVDVTLYPLDTLKTRLQAKQGFKKAGGFHGIYKGIGPQVMASAPQAALFFVTYDGIKYYLEPKLSSHALPFLYMGAASLAEIVACLVRCPMEVVKQRRQTSHVSSLTIVVDAYKSEGFFRGLYRGFGSMIVREVPFSFIQFPILEYLKSTYRIHLKNNIPLESYEVALCGAVAGGFSAAITTPLDVAKTRIMLADKSEVSAGTLTVRNTLGQIYKENGYRGLFAGILPRTVWITLGGYIFFGAYDFAKKFASDALLEVS